MPLFLLIRHGESTANRRNFVHALAVRAEGLTPREAQARMVAESREANGDAVLTDNGMQQAELLGLFWSKILKHKAKEGRVRVVVSPMTRNLQTADPLVRYLNAELAIATPQAQPQSPSQKAPKSPKSQTVPAATSVPATVNPDLFEIPGLFHPDDCLPFFQLQDGLMRSTGDEARKLRKTMANYPWRPAGLSVDEMKSKFPWCTIPDDKLVSRRHEGELGQELALDVRVVCFKETGQVESVPFEEVGHLVGGVAQT